MAAQRTQMTRSAFQEALVEGQPPTDSLLRKQFVAEVKRAGNRLRQFCISTGAIDRDNDTIDPAGWKLENYKKNPVVLWAHDYSSLPLGRATEIHVADGRLLATAEFADHPMAETVLQLIDGGFMRATSVGFRPMKAVAAQDRDGLDFKEQELLEFSIVPVPANPEALIVASKSIDLDPVKGWARVALGISEDTETVLRLADSDDDADACVLVLADEAVDPLPDAAEMAAAVRAALPDALSAALREIPAQVTAALRGARGQVD